MFRFLKNKRKYTYPEIKIPEGCRELTEEEMLLVNGGGKAKDETVVTVESGDTLSELTAKLNEQNGTDYTYEEIALLNGITDPNTIYAGQTIVFPGTRQPESGSDSGSSGDTPSSPSSSNSTNDATANTVKGPEHRSAHDQKYINEMMEKDRKNALGRNGIQGNAVTGKKVEEKKINVKPGTGNMTVSDYIAKQRKLGTGTTVSGQTVGREFVKENTAYVKAMSGTTINANGHSHHSGSFEDPNLTKKAQTKLYQAAEFIITHAETQDEKAVADAVKYMMNNKKVQLDKVTSRHEKENMHHSKTEKGFTDFYHNTETGEERGIIVIDTRKAEEENLGELIETLTHEGWHVVQHERGRFEITVDNNFKLNVKKEPGKTFDDYHTDFEYEAFSMGLNMYNKYMIENGMSPANPYDWNQIKSIYLDGQK